MRSLTVSSELAVTAQALWHHAITPEDINAEFQPLLRMTFPQGLDDVTANWTPGRRRFRSWILLLGVIPVDYDDLTFTEVVPGAHFTERSRMLSQSVWEHDRVITPIAGGARLTDRVRFESRAAWLEPLFEYVFTWVFRYRHRSLRRRYGRALTT